MPDYKDDVKNMFDKLSNKELEACQDFAEKAMKFKKKQMQEKDKNDSGGCWTEEESKS